jgi:hypothetical protein
MKSMRKAAQWKKYAILPSSVFRSAQVSEMIRHPMPPIRSLLVAALAALVFTYSVRAAAPSQDDEARFLAGLSVKGTPLETLTVSGSSAWEAHTSAFDSAWAELDKHQLKPIAAWIPMATGHWATDKSPLLYFFSGPDFLYAHAFFPNASTYVLCGIEPIGTLPQVESIPPAALDSSLSTLRDSLDSILNFSFFITKKMKVQLVADSRLTGTLPLLYVFLERSGCRIVDVSFTGLDKTGQFTTGKTDAPAVKIDFTGPAGQAQTLYYFSTDLSDGSVESSGFLKWCASLGPAPAFLKAASYLMHGQDFNSSRDFLLSDCPAVLQDDSGIPVKFFPQPQWDLRLFGNYSGPIDMFKKYPQPELDALKAAQKPVTLPFSVGYRWHSGQSSLIFAVKTAAGLRPAPMPAATPAAVLTSVHAPAQ